MCHFNFTIAGKNQKNRFELVLLFVVMNPEKLSNGSGPIPSNWSVTRAFWRPMSELPLSINGVKNSAESILTLKNRESIHFGFFDNRLRWKESIHTMNRFIIYIGDTWKFMYRDTRYTVFKNRLSTSWKQTFFCVRFGEFCVCKLVMSTYGILYFQTQIIIRLATIVYFLKHFRLFLLWLTRRTSKSRIFAQIALLCIFIRIQNEEFMAELRSDTDFMAALQLEHDEAVVVRYVSLILRSIKCPLDCYGDLNAPTSTSAQLNVKYKVAWSWILAHCGRWAWFTVPSRWEL